MFYYRLNKILSHNALFNYILGNRGGGKTFASKEYVINKFLKNKEQFVYLRRYKSEISKAKKSFVDDIENIFPNEKFEIKGNNILINKEIAGHFISLSNAKIHKSVSFPHVFTIIFDEFILDKGYHHYLQDEVIAFLELYETIARTRDVKVLFLSNSISISNPYFIYFNIEKSENIENYYNNGDTFSRYNKLKKRFPDIAVEFYANKDFIEMKKNTRFGSLINNTKYSLYSIENEMLRDDINFVSKKPQSIYYITLIINSESIGIWYENGIYYLSKDLGNNNKIFSYGVLSHNEDSILLVKSDYIIKNLILAFKKGKLYFEDIKIKNLFYEILK